jgi:hypothetical protein
MRRAIGVLAGVALAGAGLAGVGCTGQSTTDGGADLDNRDIMPTSVRVTTAGGPSFDRAYDIAVDRNGVRYVTGYFERSATFGSITVTAAGYSDLFVAKLDLADHFVWVATASGGSGPSSYNAIAVDGYGNILVSGHFMGSATFGSHSVSSRGDDDAFVALLDKQGTFQWVTTWGEVGTEGARDLAPHLDGGCTVVGYFSSQQRIGGFRLRHWGQTDVFVARVDELGRVKWATSAGSPLADEGVALDVAPNGAATITGYFKGRAHFGSQTLVGEGGGDLFVARLSPDGVFQWAVAGGGTESCTGCALALDSKGNSHVAGTFYGVAKFGGTELRSSGVADLFVTRLDPAGRFVWTTSAGGDSLEQVGGVAVTGDGQTYVTGSFIDAAFFGPVRLVAGVSSDLYLAGVSSGGEFRWAQLAGGSKAEGANGLALWPDGSPHLTGYFRGLANFAGRQVQSAGDADIFIWDY